MWGFFNGAESNTMNDICGDVPPIRRPSGARGMGWRSPGIKSPATIWCPVGARGEAARPGRGVMMLADG